MGQIIRHCLINNNAGITIISFAFGMAVLMLSICYALLDANQIAIINRGRVEVYESKEYLMTVLNESVQLDLTMKNSRFLTNPAIAACIPGGAALVPPTGINCSEEGLKDILLYPLAPLMTINGAWQAPSARMPPITGGLSNNTVY